MSDLEVAEDLGRDAPRVLRLFDGVLPRPDPDVDAVDRVRRAVIEVARNYHGHQVGRHWDGSLEMIPNVFRILLPEINHHLTQAMNILQGGQSGQETLFVDSKLKVPQQY